HEAVGLQPLGCCRVEANDQRGRQAPEQRRETSYESGQGTQQLRIRGRVRHGGNAGAHIAHDETITNREFQNTSQGISYWSSGFLRPSDFVFSRDSVGTASETQVGVLLQSAFVIIQ